MNKLLLAFQFLTIVPVRDLGELSDEEVGSSTALFPLVGFVEGMIFTAMAMLCLSLFTAEITNGLIIIAMVLLNGCLHIDGLADTFDAVASRGDTEKKLSIMKDSTTGPAGVTAIALMLLMKYILLNAVFFVMPVEAYYAAVFLMPVLARWVIVPAVFHGRSARKEGLGRLFIEHTGTRELITATALTVLVSAAVCIITVGYPMLLFIVMFSMPVLYIFGWLAAWFCNTSFTGMTGDTVGALYELSIPVLLMAEVAWSQKFI